MKKLIKHRASHQRSINRMEISSNAFDENSPVTSLESSLELLEDYWIKFQSVQLNIQEKSAEEEMNDAVKVMIDTEQSYMKAKVAITTLLDVRKRRDQNNVIGNQQNVNRQRNVKLPKLEVPKFDGSFANWLSFKDLFTSMVRNQTTLTDGEKLQYLKPNLDGEAKDIVNDYKVTDANFEAAWMDLEERYDNKRLQVQAHLSILFDQEVIQYESAEALRLLLRTTQKCLRSLQSLGAPIDAWDWFLGHLTVIKLDPKTKRYWELKHTAKEVPTWQELITALDIRCNALESEESN